MKVPMEPYFDPLRNGCIVLPTEHSSRHKNKHVQGTFLTTSYYAYTQVIFNGSTWPMLRDFKRLFQQYISALVIQCHIINYLKFSGLKTKQNRNKKKKTQGIDFLMASVQRESRSLAVFFWPGVLRLDRVWSLLYQSSKSYSQ